MTDFEGCSVNDFLCKPCHFLGLTTETLIYCEVLKHELQLGTLTYLWKTQNMDWENIKNKNLLFCKEQRQFICQAITMTTENNFDLLSMIGAIPVFLGILIWVISTTLESQYYYFCLKSEQTEAQRCYMLAQVTQLVCGTSLWQYLWSGLSASNTWVFLHELLLRCAGIFSTRTSYSLVK